jgi:uncharacterized Zn-binding protein involved in type VI secretion
MRSGGYFLVTAITLLASATANAQNAPSTGAVIQGSPDVSVGGGAAARQGDATTGGAPVVEGSSNVFINGKPAVTVGGRTGCGGAVMTGTSNVFVNGKPLARAGDKTAGCDR